YRRLGLEDFAPIRSQSAGCEIDSLRAPTSFSRRSKKRPTISQASSLQLCRDARGGYDRMDLFKRTALYSKIQILIQTGSDWRGHDWIASKALKLFVNW